MDLLNQVSILETTKTDLDYQLSKLGERLNEVDKTVVENWASRIKKASIISTIKQKISQLEKYKSFVIIDIGKVQEKINEENRFQEFLQPFRDAKFIIYDDGKVAYLAQTLQNIKPFNEVLLGGCFVHPDVFSKFKKQLKENKLSLKDVLPGDYDALSEKYLKMSKASVMNNLRQLFRSNGHITSCSIHFKGDGQLYL